VQSTLSKIGIPAALLVAAAFFAAYLLMPPPPPKKVSIATGRTDGVYYRYAVEYKKALAKEGIDLVILPTAGSVEALEAAEHGRVDFAFMQGGTADANITHTLGLATIYFEPLWIFYADSLNPELLNDLKGLTIGIGEKGSGTYILSRKILDASGIDANNSTLSPLPLGDGIKALRSGEIEALFSVISADSALIAKALHQKGIGLLACRRAPAYAKKFGYLSEVTLFEGALDLAENIPEKETRMIATTAQLVANENASPEIIRLLLRKAKQIHSKPTLFADAGTFPTEKYLQLPIHEEAKRYLERGDSWLERTFPFPIATLIDRLLVFLIPLITLLLPLAKGFLPIYRWRIRHQIYRWYKLLRQIDEKADSLDEKGLTAELKRISELQKEVQEHVNVPLSYMGEYYLLREHIDLIKEKLLSLIRKRKHNIAEAKP